MTEVPVGFEGEQVGFEGLVAEILAEIPKELEIEEAKTMEGDFPKGTSLKLTTKKYLWGVLGACSLDIPVAAGEQVEKLVDAWFDFQKDLEEAYADEIKELYSRSYKSGKTPTSSSGGDDEDKKKDMRGLAFTIGTQKGVYVMQRWKDIGTMSEAELGEVLDTLRAMPDKTAKTAGEGDDAAKAASTRVRRARGSRR